MCMELELDLLFCIKKLQIVTYHSCTERENFSRMSDVCLLINGSPWKKIQIIFSWACSLNFKDVLLMNTKRKVGTRENARRGKPLFPAYQTQTHNNCQCPLKNRSSVILKTSALHIRGNCTYSPHGQRQYWHAKVKAVQNNIV